MSYAVSFLLIPAENSGKTLATLFTRFDKKLNLNFM
jgi:hypothetical protein